MIAVDANILVYASEAASKSRHFRARSLLEVLATEDRLLLPLQVLGEFYNVATRKLGHQPEFARALVEGWKSVAWVEPYGSRDLASAMALHAEHKLAFWDAMILTVVERCGVDLLASEDFQSGRRIGGVTILDPFDPANAERLGLDRAP